MKKKYLILLASLLLIISFTGCTETTKKSTTSQKIPITFSWWGNDTRNEYTLEAIDTFMNLHPDIKVNCSYGEWSGYQTRNRIQMVSNTAADLMQINYDWLSTYSPNGKGYYDLSTLSDTIDLSNFTKEQLEYGTSNHILNAAPIALNAITLYINETIYNQYGVSIPKTWDEYFTAAKKMDGKSYPLSAPQKSIWLCCISYEEGKLQKHVFSDDGKLQFTAEDFADTISFYCRLVNEKVIPQVEHYDRNNIQTGVYAGYIAWVNDANSYSAPATQNGFKYVVAPYPTANKNLFWHIKPATLYAISSETEHPKQAAELLDYLLNSKEMAEKQGIEKGIPLSHSARSYLNQKELQHNLQYTAATQVESNMNIMAPLHPSLESEEIINCFNDSCNNVLYQKSTLKEQGEVLFKKYKQILKGEQE